MATVMAFHAHPDDEVVFTGGTLARLAAEGHRAVIVVATDGVVGEATGEDGAVRMDELRASAAILGVARVIHLGYADSGHGPLFHPDPPDRTRFARADTEQAAAKLADLLREENVDVLLSYDAQGGYGHRDHVKVHEVGARAAQMADTPVLEATRPREPIYRMYRTLRFLRLPINTDPQEVRDSYYSPRATITHQIDVRRYARQKCIALAAHRSQMSGSSRANIAFRVLLHLPTPILGLAFGREWFIDPTTPPGATPIGDILQNLR